MKLAKEDTNKLQPQKKITYNELVEWKENPSEKRTFSHSDILHIIIDFSRAKENVKNFKKFKKIYATEMCKKNTYTLNFIEFISLSSKTIVKFLHLAEYDDFCPQKGKYSKELSSIIASSIPEQKKNVRTVHRILLVMDYLFYCFTKNPNFVLSGGLGRCLKIAVFAIIFGLIIKSVNKQMNKRTRLSTIIKIHLLYIMAYVCILDLIAILITLIYSCFGV